DRLGAGSDIDIRRPQLADDDRTSIVLRDGARRVGFPIARQGSRAKSNAASGGRAQYGTGAVLRWVPVVRAVGRGLRHRDVAVLHLGGRGRPRVAHASPLTRAPVP